MSALSGSDEWRTPDALFDACSAYYGPFDVDVAAAKWNHRCERYFTKRANGLKQSWGRRNWCNPPYSRGNLFRWTVRARALADFDSQVELNACLVPAYTSERWWQQNVLDGLGQPCLEHVRRHGIGSGFRTLWSTNSGPNLVVEVVFVDGRLRFRHKTGKADSARHPSAVVVFAKPGVLHA